MGDPTMSDSLTRYSRQILFPAIGSKGQEQLAAAKVGLVGLGALGATIAEILVRAGIGHLVAIDRDVVESSNLHRQGLYREQDAALRMPKAVAAAKALEAINAKVVVEAHAKDFNATNAEELFAGCSLLLDGSDGFETRYLINDLAIEMDVPWIYGACLASGGMTATIRPGVTPCLACLFPEPPEPGTQESCDTAGIIAPAAQITASLQVTEALKYLVGDLESLRNSLLSFELWPFRLVEIGKNNPRPRKDCRSCAEKDLRYLHDRRPTKTVSLCGRNSVQIIPGERQQLDLAEYEARLSKVGELQSNSFSLTLKVGDHHITVFQDGRGLVRGTDDPGEARSLYQRYVGL
ncbi:MAG: ThiF family adenylyltransferase [Planctomycetota bacterium]